MPLLDHFQPPLHPERRWESFLTIWATEMAAALNGPLLPQDSYAEAKIHIGNGVEVDITTWGESLPIASAWAPPQPPLQMPALFPDEIEVQVFGTTTGALLVAAVELVSPGNKDRPEARRAFAIKVASYLQMGIGVLVVDVVTERSANLHDELIDLLQKPAEFRFPGAPGLYAAAYRPARREPAGDQIDIWPVALGLGEALPTMPLALRDGPTLPLNLETTYTQARVRSRL